MNTTLHLVLQIGNTRETLLHLIDTPEEVARYAEQIRTALEPMTKLNPSKPKAGRPGRMVIITAIDDEKHDWWANEQGAGHVRDLDKKEFASTGEASRYLGCRSNEVGIRLSAAKRFGRDEAKVRGVTFKFADDFGSSK